MTTTLICPFCGSIDIEHASLIEFGTAQSVCGGCGAFGPTGNIPVGSFGGATRVSQEAWNRRANPMSAVTNYPESTVSAERAVRDYPAAALNLIRDLQNRLDAVPKTYPAIYTVTIPQGPQYCCEKHASQMIDIMHAMGAAASLTDGAQGNQCGNCINEAAKAK